MNVILEQVKEFLELLITEWWGILIIACLAVALVILLYKPFFKAFFDFFLALLALIILSPVFLTIAILIKATSPGPVFFRQKRIGRKKKLFKIHKFRTMRIDTPKDVPTHQLQNPDAYITKIGKFLRKTSLDELPQIWDIFRLKMSIIGPRPALYNQDDLIVERDKYNANRIRPGLTGLAQVSGRDELEIPVKAKIDGDYVNKRNIFIDIKIFFLTVFKVFKSDGVVEGGTGAIIQNSEFRIQNCGLNENAEIIPICAKKILITGANSYVGSAVEAWLKNAGHEVTVLDMIGDGWRGFDFSPFDAVFHVAGIAHIKANKKNKSLYYKINRDLAIETATKAKESGVKQFVFMSSMSLYDGYNTMRKGKSINEKTAFRPKGYYGDSKMQADLAIQKLQSDSFNAAVLRPPMIYGPNCKGNFPRLVKLAMKAPFFPKIKNQRSMLYIENLCEFVKRIIETESAGVYFPQDSEYYCTSELAAKIAAEHGKKLRLTKLFNWLVWLACPFLPPLKKLFGNLTYEKNESGDNNI